MMNSEIEFEDSPRNCIKSNQNCMYCKKSLTENNYVLVRGHLCCLSCFEQNVASTCAVCKNLIGLGVKHLTFNDRQWHDICFRCSCCGLNLKNQPFYPQNDRIYCATCYKDMHDIPCAVCGDKFEPGIKMLCYKKKHYHESCFQCSECQSQIGIGHFVVRYDDVYCPSCYDTRFGICFKCDKKITSECVLIKKIPFHKTCFVCVNCSCQLPGKKFIILNGYFYCAKCYTDLFAPQCTACQNPIVGNGQKTFFCINNRSWHPQCFICANCCAALRTDNVHTDYNQYYCSKCARLNRLKSGTSGFYV